MDKPNIENKEEQLVDLSIEYKIKVIFVVLSILLFVDILDDIQILIDHHPEWRVNILREKLWRKIFLEVFDIDYVCGNTRDEIMSWDKQSLELYKYSLKKFFKRKKLEQEKIDAMVENIINFNFLESIKRGKLNNLEISEKKMFMEDYKRWLKDILNKYFNDSEEVEKVVNEMYKKWFFISVFYKNFTE